MQYSIKFSVLTMYVLSSVFNNNDNVLCVWANFPLKFGIVICIMYMLLWLMMIFTDFERIR